jgi:hypothetical protein
VTIVLAPDTEKRDIEIPIQLRKALGAKLTEKPNRLSFSHKKEFVVWYSGAKKEDTRARRVEKMKAMLSEEGHQLITAVPPVRPSVATASSYAAARSFGYYAASAPTLQCAPSESTNCASTPPKSCFLGGMLKQNTLGAHVPVKSLDIGDS